MRDLIRTHQNPFGLEDGDRIIAVRNELGQTPGERNQCHAILGEAYYITHVTDVGANITHELGGELIASGYLTFGNMWPVDMPKENIVVEYKRGGVKAQQLIKKELKDVASIR